MFLSIPVALYDEPQEQGGISELEGTKHDCTRSGNMKLFVRTIPCA